MGGLYEEELIDLHVFRADVTGRLREVPRREHGRWDLSAVSEAWDQLRVVLPAAADANLSTLDVTVDGERHRRDRRHPGSWTQYDVGDHRVLRNQRDIAWRLDATHRRAAWRYGLGMSLALCLLTIALTAAGQAAVRRGIVSRGEARRLIGAGAAVGTIAAAPLHILRRGGELFFGGAEGLLPDTLGSLVRSSAYDLVLPDEAVWIVAAVVIAWVVALALASRGRRAGRPRGGPDAGAALRGHRPGRRCSSRSSTTCWARPTWWRARRCSCCRSCCSPWCSPPTGSPRWAEGRGSWSRPWCWWPARRAPHSSCGRRNLSEALDWRERRGDAADARRHRDHPRPGRQRR